MDYEMIRLGLANAIPMVKYLGLEIVEVGPGAASCACPTGRSC